MEALRPRKKTTDFRLAVECISVVLVSSITFVQPKREESTERFGAQRERERGDGERGTFALLAQKTPMILPFLVLCFPVAHMLSDDDEHCYGRKPCLPTT